MGRDKSFSHDGNNLQIRYLPHLARRPFNAFRLASYLLPELVATSPCQSCESRGMTAQDTACGNYKDLHRSYPQHVHRPRQRLGRVKD